MPAMVTNLPRSSSATFRRPRNAQHNPPVPSFTVASNTGPPCHLTSAALVTRPRTTTRSRTWARETVVVGCGAWNGSHARSAVLGDVGSGQPPHAVRSKVLGGIEAVVLPHHRKRKMG